MATSNGIRGKKSDEITIKFIFMQSFIRMKNLESEPLNLSESCRGFACVCVYVITENTVSRTIFSPQEHFAWNNSVRRKMSNLTTIQTNYSTNR